MGKPSPHRRTDAKAPRASRRRPPPRPLQGRAKFVVTPRVLLFLERGGRWLFLRGGPSKWFAGRLNGLGGSVEAGEDARAAALREAREECGLAPSVLRLSAVLHLDAQAEMISLEGVRARGRRRAATAPRAGVLLFVFAGKLGPGEVATTGEGELEWHPLAAVTDPSVPFLDDVRSLLPTVAAQRPGAAPLFLTLPG